GKVAGAYQELQALVPQLANVLRGYVKAGGLGHRYIQQQVGGISYIGVRADAEAALQDGYIQPEVELPGRFPLQVLVLKGGRGSAGQYGTANRVIAAGANAAQPGIALVAQLVVAYQAPAGAQLQVIDSCYIPHKILIGNTPAGGYRGEVAP